MFGVVLWSDQNDRKAVIWCEDQGDLAFYRHTDEAQEIVLEAGDWVQFDLDVKRQQRLAHNPRLIEGGACRSLPTMLVEAREEMLDEREPASPDNQARIDDATLTAEIIPFNSSGRLPDTAVVQEKACRA